MLGRDRAAFRAVLDPAVPLARLEPYGVMILLTLMLLPPIVGPQLGLDFNIISRLISGPTEAILRAILRLTGNG